MLGGERGERETRRKGQKEVDSVTKKDVFMNSDICLSSEHHYGPPLGKGRGEGRDAPEKSTGLESRKGGENARHIAQPHMSIGRRWAAIGGMEGGGAKVLGRWWGQKEREEGGGGNPFRAK